MSTLPNRSTALATRAAQSLSLPAWVGTAKARSPMDAATWCSASGLRAASTTDAPLSAYARAMASPIPRLAPVMMATFPSSVMRAVTGGCLPRDDREAKGRAPAPDSLHGDGSTHDAVVFVLPGRHLE